MDVRELFYATPARLKFLKSQRSEDLATLDVVKRLAMARPDVGFTLTIDGRSVLALEREDDLFGGRLKRLARIMGRDFAENSAPVEAARETVRISGFAGLPTYHRASSSMQFLIVNGRPVRDKLLFGAVRGAYADYLAHDRYPALALFLDCDPAFVDVNVHPAKTEVRFRDAGLARGLIVSALKHALAGAGHRASSTVAESALAALSPPFRTRHAALSRRARPAQVCRSGAAIPGAAVLRPHGRTGAFRRAWKKAQPRTRRRKTPLGVARAQVHDAYIIAQTGDGIVIVDQHAAHERIVYERLKHGLEAGGVPLPAAAHSRDRRTGYFRGRARYRSCRGACRIGPDHQNHSDPTP